MGALLLFRNIYLEAIRNIKNYFLKNYIKVYSTFTFILLIVALYALIYRIWTGFAFG